jgi:hypothetical protein
VKEKPAVHPMPYTTPRKLHPLSVKIPRALFDEVRILALDPSTGQARYGFWSRTITMLIRRWLDEQRSPHPAPIDAHDIGLLPPIDPVSGKEAPIWRADWSKEDNNAH